MQWLLDNIGTIAVALVLVAVIGLIVFRLIRAKKSGKGSCSCGCSECAMRGMCHKDSQDA